MVFFPVFALIDRRGSEIVKGSNDQIPVGCPFRFCRRPLQPLSKYSDASVRLNRKDLRQMKAILGRTEIEIISCSGGLRVAAHGIQTSQNPLQFRNEPLAKGILQLAHKDELMSKMGDGLMSDPIANGLEIKAAIEIGLDNS